MMKAIVFRKDEGIVFENVPKPVPEANQVLIRLANAGFCGSDHSIIEYKYVADGFILGHEVSGAVVEVGADVDEAIIGSRFTVRPHFCGTCKQCGEGRTTLCKGRRSIGHGDLYGGFAEYMVAFPEMLIPIPDGADSRNASIAEVFATALHAVNSSMVRGGSALVIGGGPIGLSLVHVLKIMGYGPIILSEPIVEKQRIGLTFGADNVIDPLNEDLLSYAKKLTDGEGFDVAFECSGIPANVQLGIDCVSAGGTVSVVSIMMGAISLDPMSINLNREVRLVGSYSSSQEEIRQCLQWMAEGVLDGRPMITDITTLEELPELYREKIHPGRTVKAVISIGEEF